VGVTRVAITVDDEVHRRAKAAAAYRGVKLWQWIEDAMREAADRQEDERSRGRL
jgi:predicted HicB family RNase H-like nuclease